MENFDELVAKQEQRQQYSKEEYAAYKQQERDELHRTIEKMTDQVFSDPKRLDEYLEIQARLGKISVGNTLLAMAHNPKATYILTAEEWAERERGIRKGQGRSAIKQFKQDKEYERDDGTMAMGYKVERCFDVSQTYGRKLPERATKSMPIKSKLKALMTDIPVPVMLSDSLSPNTGAAYSEENKAVEVARGLDGNKLFYCIARELTRAEHHLAAFSCGCAAAITCKRFGIPAPLPEQIPQEYVQLETQDKRFALGQIHKAANGMIERIDQTLYAELRRQKDQPSR